MSDPAERAPVPRFGVLRTIALYKIVKVLLLLAVAYGELKLRDASLVARILEWASARPGRLETTMITHLVEWFSGLSTSRIATLRIVTLAYAAVFAVEGIGLWMNKRWAEWLTVIITASLIPVEAYEMLHRPSVGKFVILLGNTAIVAYLIWHVRKSNRAATPPLQGTGGNEAGSA